MPFVAAEEQADREYDPEQAARWDVPWLPVAVLLALIAGACC